MDLYLVFDPYGDPAMYGYSDLYLAQEAREGTEVILKVFSKEMSDD